MSESPPSPAVIELEQFSVELGGRRILKNLNGRLTGRSIGLLGPNGAGKTTLLLALLGFHAPSGGTARIFGHDVVTGLRDFRQLIGYMPENDSFISGMSGIRFVTQMAELSGLPHAQALERAHEALFYIGLGEARYRNLDTYSLGMKQLAKLAQAIAHGPRLLVLDEPTNGLDPPNRARMIRLIRDIRDSGEVNVILSSHLLKDVEECCEEVLVLKEGVIATYCNLEQQRQANRKFLDLETAGEAEAFLAAARDRGCETAPGVRRGVRMVLPKGVEVRDLYAMAAEHGAEIRRVSDKRDSLEDIFLKAMESASTATEVVAGC